MEEEKKECFCENTRERTEEELTVLIHRLNRVTGQVSGIKNMLERNAYCMDILVQVAAAKAALDSFAKELLDEHIHTCIVEDIQNGSLEKVDELIGVLKRLMR